MAAIRLDDSADNIENTLSLALLDTAKANATDRSIVSVDPLASSSWETVMAIHRDCALRADQLRNILRKMQMRLFFSLVIPKS